jgi:hypothetical protein
MSNQTQDIPFTGTPNSLKRTANTCLSTFVAWVVIVSLTFSAGNAKAGGCPVIPVNLGGPYTQCSGSVTLDAGAFGATELLNEGMDGGTSLVTYTPAGWVQQNNSVPGTTQWFGGNTATFAPHGGAGYIAANFNNTTGTNDISNWLLTPNLTMKNGDVFSFWTRTVTSPAFPDRLQVRLSGNGASTNVGTGAAGVGDFTTLLLDINPTLTTAGYPTAWTQYNVTISGLAGPTSGRLAFRYFVTGAGPSGNNSDYIGIDDVVYTSTGVTYAWSNGATTQTTSVSTSGTYSVTVTDGNGCTGSGSANVTIGSPVVNLGGPYTQCGGSVTLDAGNAGSGYLWSTGATSQTIAATASGSYAVTVTDANTCTGTASANVTISSPPSSTTGYEVCQGGTVPSGEGLLASGCGSGVTTVTSFTGTTTLSDPTFNRGLTGTTYTASGTGTAVHYQTHTFTVSVTGSYTFTLCTGGFDSYLHIYTNSFNPVSPATNFLVADDDGAACGSGSEATVTLTAGTTYVFVATGFSNTDVGSYTVTFAGPGAVQQGSANTIVWYDAATGGSSIGGGSPFNPVGGSLLPNTNTPGTYTFYAACSSTPDCRTAVTFVVNPSPIVNLGGPFVQCSGTVTLDAGSFGGSNFSEGFDAGTSQVTYTPAGGWVQQNNSIPGTTQWFGGNTATFAAHSGAGYIAANFNNTTGANDISNWLLTPTISMQNGDVFSFWTRTVNAPAFPDRLQVRMSTNGVSTNVGTGAAGLGDFTTLLLDINPTLTTAGYPNAWTQYNVTISGLSGSTSGRLAFRYFVTGAGPSGANSDYIGIDDVTYVSSSPSFSYAWSNGASTQSTVVSASGTYSVTVTDPNGCSGSTSTSVTIGSPVVNLGGPYTQCGGSVTLDAGNAGSSYAWSNGATSQTIAASSSGNYTVTVTDANACTGTGTAVVTIDAPPSSVSGYEVCQGGAVPSGEGLLASGCSPAISAVTSFTGTTALTDPTFTRGNTGTTYAASATGTAVHYQTHSFTVSTSGTYTFTVCAGFDTYLHIYANSFNPASPATNFLVADDDAAACGTGSEASVTLTAGTTYVFVTTGFANSDVGTYTVTFAGPGSVQQSSPSTIVWYDAASSGSSIGGGSPFNPVGSSLLPNTNTPGTYTFYAACSGSPACRVAVDFVVNPTPVVNLGGPYTSCNTVTLDAGNAGSSYAWSNGATSQTIDASSSGTYAVTVTDANACSGSGSASVTISTLAVNLGGPYTQCSGSVTLDAGAFGATELLNEGMDGGTSLVTYTPAGWVQQNNSVPGTTQWFGGNTATFAPHGGAGYIAANFNNTTGTNDISNWLLTPNLTMKNGDVFSFWTRTVTSPAFPDRLQVRLSGNGASTNVGTGAAGVGDFTTLLLDINPTLTTAGYPTAWTQYNVTISGLAGPTSGRLAFRYFVTGAGPSGNNSDYIGIDDVVYTSTGVTYAWSNGATTQTTSVSTSGTYSVTVTDGNGCTGSGSANVTIGSPVVNLGGPYTQCGGSVTLDAGNAGSGYLWSTGATSQTIAATASGSYAVTVTDANTCTGTASANVTISSPPSSTTGYEVCQGGTVPSGEGLLASGCGSGVTTVTSFTGTTTLSDPTFNRSVGGTTYTASGVGTAVHYQTHTFTVSVTGSYTFTLCTGGFDSYLHIYANSFDPLSPATNFLVADDDGAACGSGSEATVTLTAGTTYVFVATGFDNTADVGSYTVTFAGPGAVQQGSANTIVWYDAATGGSSIGGGSPFNPVGGSLLPNTNTPGTYTFYAACSSTPDCRTAVTFVVNPSPVVNLGGPYTQCGGNVTLDAGNAGSSYAWSGTETTQTVSATSTGSYSVTVTDANSCSGSGSASVTINAIPTVNLGGPYTQCGGSVTLDAGNAGSSYAWSGSETTQTVSATSTGSYSVTVNRCK